VTDEGVDSINKEAIQKELAASTASLNAPTMAVLCSCSDETLCLIGDCGDSTSHSVCRHIDDRGIDGDLISRGVGGLVDNRVDGEASKTENV
jgi:hypothetical protein